VASALFGCTRPDSRSGGEGGSGAGIGAAGLIGVTGTSGSSGALASAGATGAAAISGRNDAGISGTTGAAGISGTTGAADVAGASATAGVNGAGSGATGGTHATSGAGGSSGRAGASGSAGQAGNAGAGATGMTGLPPGDIAASAGTPLVAAHSMTRALYAAYNGRLFQLRRASDGKTQDIGVARPGGDVDTDLLNTFCSNTSCSISLLYDQSGNANDLPQATPANQPVIQYWKTSDGTQLPMAVTVNKQWLRNRTKTHKIPVGAESQTEYWVVHGSHYNSGCCYDYGNMETTVHDDGPGTMSALYFGSSTAWTKGAGKGPWGMTDYENGLFSGAVKDPGGTNANYPSLAYPGNNIVMVLTKSNGTSSWALKAGNAASGTLNTYWSGSLPAATDTYYSPLRQEGGLSLGEGGDGSNSGTGAFSEGVVIAAVTTDATDDLIQANIVSVYGR
jgi:hypothetical protein